MKPRASPSEITLVSFTGASFLLALRVKYAVLFSSLKGCAFFYPVIDKFRFCILKVFINPMPNKTDHLAVPSNDPDFYEQRRNGRNRRQGPRSPTSCEFEVTFGCRNRRNGRSIIYQKALAYYVTVLGLDVTAGDIRY